MLTVSLMIARGALMREESRGGHSRLDFTRTTTTTGPSTTSWSTARAAWDKDMVLTPTPVVKRDELTELVEARKEAEKAS